MCPCTGVGRTLLWCSGLAWSGLGASAIGRAIVASRAAEGEGTLIMTRSSAPIALSVATGTHKFRPPLFRESAAPANTIVLSAVTRCVDASANAPRLARLCLSSRAARAAYACWPSARVYLASPALSPTFYLHSHSHSSSLDAVTNLCVLCESLNKVR